MKRKIMVLGVAVASGLIGYTIGYLKGCDPNEIFRSFERRGYEVRRF